MGDNPQNEGYKKAMKKKIVSAFGKKALAPLLTEGRKALLKQAKDFFEKEEVKSFGELDRLVGKYNNPGYDLIKAILANREVEKKQVTDINKEVSQEQYRNLFIDRSEGGADDTKKETEEEQPKAGERTERKKMREKNKADTEEELRIKEEDIKEEKKEEPKAGKRGEGGPSETPKTDAKDGPSETKAEIPDDQPDTSSADSGPSGPSTTSSSSSESNAPPQQQQTNPTTTETKEKKVDGKKQRISMSNQNEFPSSIDNIPQTRLSSNFKNKVELIGDIKYFYSNFESALTNIIKKNKNLGRLTTAELQRLHKRIVATLNPTSSKKGGRVGVVIDAEEYIKSVMNQAMIDKAIENFKLPNLEPLGKLKTDDNETPDGANSYGSYEVKRGPDGGLNSQNEPVYRYIPTTQPEQIEEDKYNYKKRRSRVELPKSKLRTQVTTAKRQLEINPFINKQGGHRVNILL